MAAAGQATPAQDAGTARGRRVSSMAGAGDRPGQAARHRGAGLHRRESRDQQGLQGVRAARPVHRKHPRPVCLRDPAPLGAAASAGGRGARGRVPAVRERPVAHQEGARALARPGTAAYSFANPEGGTMIRPLLAALVLCMPAANAAENLDAAPIGTAVTGSFELGGRLIPLPEGTFQLAARSINEPAMLEGSIAIPPAKIALVILVDIKPPRLRAAVHARVALKPQYYRGFHWLGQPCRKDDTLYRADLTGSHGEDENCLLVDHSIRNFSPRGQGIWKDAADWLTAQNVQLPVPVLVTANVTRFQNTQLVTSSYASNPRMHRCNAPISRPYPDIPSPKNGPTPHTQ